MRGLVNGIGGEVRELGPETLWVTDAELIRRMGCPEKIAREAIRMLDKDPRRTGFPQKNALWGGRRYWPAVRAYLDRQNGLIVGPSWRETQ